MLFRNFDTVVSYTTRPMRDYETNGKEHYFVTNGESRKILQENTICAITVIGEHTYFVTKAELENPKKNLYIIDPDGLTYLLEHFRDIRNFSIIYVKASDEVRHERAKSRPGYDEKIYTNRCVAELSQFTSFEFKIADKDYNYKHRVHVDIVENNSDNLKTTMKKVKKIIRKYDRDTVFLVIGRTCSGKDTICSELVKESGRFRRCLNSVLSFLHITQKSE